MVTIATKSDVPYKRSPVLNMDAGLIVLYVSGKMWLIYLALHARLSTVSPIVTMETAD
jgi:hypothetical protein